MGPPTVSELMSQLQAENERLKNIIRKVFPEKSGQYFICGEIGKKDNNDLPEFVEICPAYGCDFSVVYQKTDRTIQGMGS